MNQEPINRWRTHLLLLLAEKVRRENPHRLSRLDDALRWIRTHPEAHEPPSEDLLPEWRLLRALPRWIDEELKSAPAAAASGRVAEEDRSYFVDPELRRWREFVRSVLQRDREDLVPRWSVREQERLHPALRELVGNSPEWLETLRLAQVAAHSRVPTLLLGETGTGRSSLAEAIHRSGTTTDSRFVRIPCQSLDESSYRSELLRIHRESGGEALDEWDSGRLFRHAGTLYFHEVADLAPAAQRAFLLPQLERRERDATDGVRILASSRIPLEKACVERGFLMDAYLRIGVFQILVPPLRKRREDIPALVAHLLERHAHRYGSEPPPITKDALEALENHSWPGNVRELANVLEGGMLRDGPSIGVKDLHFQPEEWLEKGEDQGRTNLLRKAANRMQEAGLKISGALPERLADFLFSVRNRRFRNTELARELGVASSTARNYLSALQRQGLVRKYGEKKGTTYQVNSEALFGGGEED